MQTSGIRKWVLGLFVVGFILIFAIVAVIFLFPRVGGGPIISIIQPDAELAITSGQGLLVIAQAKGDLPIQRVDLLVNDEFASQQMLGQAEAREVTVSIPWFSSELGRHSLSVIAYDIRNRPSDPAQVYVTVFRAGTLLDSSEVESLISSDQSASNGQDNGQEASDEDEGEGLIFDGGVGQPGGVIGGLPQLGDQPFLDVNFPDILPPTVTFDVSYTRRPAGGLVDVSYTVQAAGTVGLDRIELRRERSDDGLSIPYIKDCNGTEICFHNDTFTMRIAETWVITAQAFDTAGQASELIVEVVQSSGEEDLGPAIIEERLQVLVEGDGADLVGGGPIIGIQDLFNWIIGEGEEQPEEQNASWEQSDCLKLTVAPGVQGCLGDFCNVDVTVEVMCDVEAPNGEDALIFLKGAYYPESEPEDGEFINTSGWNQSGRAALSSGSQFVIQDSRQCGSSTNYSAILAYGNYPDSNLRAIDKAEVVHDFPPCSQDAISENINLSAENFQHEDRLSTLVHYQFNPAGIWSTQLPTGPVDMKIFGHSSDYFEALGQHEFSLEGSALPGSSGEYSFFAAQFCDRPSYYTFVGTYNSNEIFRVTTSPPIRPCPYELPVDIPIDLEFVERNLGGGDRYPYIIYRYEIPPGVAWPEGDGVMLGLMHEGDTLSLELVVAVSISDEIRQGGYTVEDEDLGGNSGQILCGFYEYRYRLAVIVNGHIRDLGPVYTITTPPCTP